MSPSPLILLGAFAMLAACSVSIEEDSVAPKQLPGESEKEPALLTVEDLASWKHEISGDNYSTMHGDLPTPAHVEKSMRDCFTDFLKIDYPERIKILDRHGRFQVPAEDFDTFYAEFLGVLGFDTKLKFSRSRRTVDLEHMGIRILDENYKHVPLDKSLKNLHFPSKRYPAPMPDAYSVIFTFVPREDKAAEYSFAFRKADGICYYGKEYSAQD